MFQVTNDESYGCIVCGEAPCICIDGNILDDIEAAQGQVAWDELQAVPSYVEQQAAAFVAEKE